MTLYESINCRAMLCLYEAGAGSEILDLNQTKSAKPILEPNAT